MDLRFAHMHKQHSHSIIRSFESLSRVIHHALMPQTSSEMMQDGLRSNVPNHNISFARSKNYKTSSFASRFLGDSFNALVSACTHTRNRAILKINAIFARHIACGDAKTRCDYDVAVCDWMLNLSTTAQDTMRGTCNRYPYAEAQCTAAVVVHSSYPIL
jgi:hypothetical protein